jgi:hypothetical protein
MRSKWSSTLIAGALATGGMLGTEVAPARAQAPSAPAGMPGAASPYPAGMPTPYPGGAPSPYVTGVAPYGGPVSASAPSAARPMSPYDDPSRGRGMPVDPATRPASISATASPSSPPMAQPPLNHPPLPSPTTPSWASSSAAAPEKKPSAMRRMVSFLLHGGSTRSDEEQARPVYRDMATGRTDLQNARPWMSSAPK